MKKHHLIISGAGRSGTTFLIKLLTNLNFDTGYHRHNMDVAENCHAGMEKDIKSKDAPYVIKNPWICDHIEDIVKDEKIHLDCAIICMRNLQAAAESRRYVESNTDKEKYGGTVPGGLWHTDKPEDQEAILAGQLYKLMVGLSKTAAAIILVNYPKMTNDAAYLYNKLKPFLAEVEFEAFERTFEQTVDRSIVHRFNDQDC